MQPDPEMTTRLKNCFRQTFPIALLALAAASCGSDKFRIKGEIEGADKESVVLEKAGYDGRWIAIDSTRTSSKGSFTFTRPALPAPEIYRLTYGGKQIYIPADSTETVTLKTTGANFGTDYTLEGSADATAMAAFDLDLIQYQAKSVPDSPNEFKKTVYTKYIQPNPASITSYYILTKQVDGKPLFDPFNGTDHKYFAAIATAYTSQRPDDPRTSLLKETSLQAMRQNNSANGRYTGYEAAETGIIEIELPDENGNQRKLSEEMTNGEPTLLVFSLLTTEDAPVLNIQLDQLKKKHSNLKIYHVSLDPDRYAWRDAAANLPWTTVFEPEGEYSKYARDYNVSVLPSFYIFKNGEITARAMTPDEIESKL